MCHINPQITLYYPSVNPLTNNNNGRGHSDHTVYSVTHYCVNVYTMIFGPFRMSKCHSSGIIASSLEVHCLVEVSSTE